MYKLIAGVLFGLLALSSGAQQTALDSLLAKPAKEKDSNKVKALIDIGNYYVTMSKPDSNKYYLLEALSEARKCGYRRGEARILTGLGHMYRIGGEYDTALQVLFASLRIRQELKLYTDMAVTHDALGRVYISLEKPDTAIIYFKYAREVYEKSNDSARLVPLLALFGDCYVTAKDFETGKKYYKTTIDTYNRWLDTRNFILPEQLLLNFRSNTIVSYSFVLVETGNAAEAVPLLEEHLEERTKKGGLAALIFYEYLGYAYLRLGEYKKSVENSLEALRIVNTANNLSLLDEKGDLNRNIAEAYYGMGDYKKAFDYFRSFKLVNDSMYSEKTARTIAEMEAKYETDKKDIRITSLTKEKKAQTTVIILSVAAFAITLVMFWAMYRSKRFQGRVYRQREELLLKEKEIETERLKTKMTGLEQKALRAQMNPHFIFNSLNTVQHFIMNKDVEGVNKYLATFAHLVRQTLNNSGQEVIALDDEVKYLETYLSLEKMKSDDRFSYAIEVGETIDQSATFIPGMILQPFVENSIRHGVAYRQNNDGHIRIVISKNGTLSCRIEDNGVGRKKAGELKTAGAGFESKGMDITMKRIETINKIYGADIKVQVEDIAGPSGYVEGTKVVVDFPVNME
ncbi:MAG: histidine kinase [Chitinophagaceae bacterium]|nr:histidine kinase [Chitinophagaceae bacterium]